ncbi:MAG: hypothetical protein ACR2PL_17840 [Dehalococcoidia bacterium]
MWRADWFIGKTYASLLLPLPLIIGLKESIRASRAADWRRELHQCAAAHVRKNA